MIDLDEHVVVGFSIRIWWLCSTVDIGVHLRPGTIHLNSDTTWRSQKRGPVVEKAWLSMKEYSMEQSENTPRRSGAAV